MSVREIELNLVNGKSSVVLIKEPVEGEHVIFDAIRLTVDESTFGNRHIVTDDELALWAGKACKEIFGFGVSSKLEKGRDFYEVAYSLGDNWGHIAFGGRRQRNSLVVSIMGQGLLSAAEGWEKRLYTFLTTEAKKPKLTRVDLAHDWFDGEHTVDEIQPLWEAGKFDRYYNRPDFEHAGPWITGDKWGKGRTAYLGSRSASVLTRFYEKGKQLGSYQSNWNRAEAEIAARGCIIPFDVLLHPTKYFCGLYPQFMEWFGHDPAKLVTEKKEKAKFETLEAQIAHLSRWETNHYGKKNAVLRQLLGDEAFLDLICTKEVDPTVFKVSDLSFAPHDMPEAEVKSLALLIPVEEYEPIDFDRLEMPADCFEASQEFSTAAPESLKQRPTYQE